MNTAVEKLERMSSGQIIKTHLPFYLLPPKLLDTCKVYILNILNLNLNRRSVVTIVQVVYVARNPKDVIVSYFHHHQLFKAHMFTGDLERFAQYFMEDEGVFDNN